MSRPETADSKRTIDHHVSKVLLAIGVDHDTTYISPDLGRVETPSEVALKLHASGLLGPASLKQLKAAGLEV